MKHNWVASPSSFHAPSKTTRCLEPVSENHVQTLHILDMATSIGNTNATWWGLGSFGRLPRVPQNFLTNQKDKPRCPWIFLCHLRFPEADHGIYRRLPSPLDGNMSICPQLRKPEEHIFFTPDGIQVINIYIYIFINHLRLVGWCFKTSGRVQAGRKWRYRYPTLMRIFFGGWIKRNPPFLRCPKVGTLEIGTPEKYIIELSTWKHTFRHLFGPLGCAWVT